MPRPRVTAIRLPPTFASHARTAYLMNSVCLSVNGVFDRELAPYGLTMVQWSVLAALRDRPAPTIASLASWFAIDQGATCHLVDRLQAKGLVVRVRKPGITRGVGVALTSNGRKVYADTLPRAMAVLDGLLGSMSKREISQLDQQLSRLIANVQEVAIRSLLRQSHDGELGLLRGGTTRTRVARLRPRNAR